MKVLLVNGSFHKDGCTYTALKEIEKTLNSHGIETEIFQTGSLEIKDCCGCGLCRKQKNNKCVFNDIANELIEKAKECDGFVFGSPVYFAHPSGRIISLMNRAFYAGKKNFMFKPAAAIASARRAGTTATLDVLMKHFTISNMPVVPSTYWNMVHGNNPDEVKQDLEGLQTMRNIGNNMAWMLKSFEIAKNSGIMPPTQEEQVRTNFIR